MNNQKGFTIVELMIAIVIFGIIMAASIPSFRNLMDQQNARNTANEIVSAINYTRSESLSSVYPASIVGINNWQSGFNVTRNNQIVRQFSRDYSSVDINVMQNNLSINTISFTDGFLQSQNVCIRIDVGDHSRVINIGRNGLVDLNTDPPSTECVDI